MKYRRARRWAGTVAMGAAAITMSACGLGDDVSTKVGNPCDLLTVDDVQSAVGQPTTGGDRTADVCAFTVEGGGKFTVGVLRGGNELFDSSIRASGGDGAQVSGVGDRAFFAGNTQFAFFQAVKGDSNVRLDYSGPNAPDQAKMTDLGRKAVENL